MAKHCNDVSFNVDPVAAIPVQLPVGLEETIAAFESGVHAANGQVDPSIRHYMVPTYEASYRTFAEEWPRRERQILMLARLAGRMAVLYAALRGSSVAQWTDASRALDDVRVESRTTPTQQSRHASQ